MTLDSYFQKKEDKMENKIGEKKDGLAINYERSNTGLKPRIPINFSMEPLVEWDGKDFRGESCSPRTRAYLRANPKVLEWVRTRPRTTMHNVACKFIQFFNAIKMTPAQFIELDKKTARDLAWSYLQTISLEKPTHANLTKSAIISFYYYHVEEKLPFIRGKHDIIIEPKKEKEHMSKDVCWRIINKTRNLHDETLLTFAYESGLRRNAISYMTYGNYQKFFWFKLDGKDVTPSNEIEGNILIFKVMATPNPDYTHDNKLRGKGIHWYFGCAHKEATKMLKEYVAKYHQHSTHDTPFWNVIAKTFLTTTKKCVKRANLNPKTINFHAFRRGFANVVRNTPGITDSDFKEAIIGHVLEGSRENYFDKDPLEFAKQYAKCDFSPSAEIVAEKERENAELRKQLEELKKEKEKTQAVEAPGVKTQIQQDDWYAQYEADMARQEKVEQPSHSLTVTKVQVQEYQIKDTSTSGFTDPTDAEIIWCPLKDDWIQQVKCHLCNTIRFEAWKDCTEKRLKNPNDSIFSPTKPKPLESNMR